MLIEAALLLLPWAVSLIYRESSGRFLLFTSLGAGVLGGLMTLAKPRRTSMYPKDGFVAVALCWIVISLIGAAPFTASGEIPSYIDAVFEMVSGFTTTGSSILTRVEDLSHGMIFWRSFSHWIGGMGILVFMLAILPTIGGPSIHLLRAESPGPSVDKIVPKMRDSAKILYVIYLIMTAVLVVLYLAGGMPVFDSFCIAFGTAGTGGFAIRSSSMGEYSAYLQVVTTIFMALFGVNFSVYFFLWKRKLRDALCNSELWTYGGILAAASVLITVNIRSQMGSWGQSALHASFAVSSVMTTTGYGTVDFNQWPEFSRVILAFLMIIGASAGSTGGGFKVSRVLLLCKTARNEINRLIHPSSVKVVRINGKRVPRETIHGVLVFMVLYVGIGMASILLVSLDGFDASTTVTSVLATLNNIGPGLGLVGPAGSFAGMSVLSKLVLTLDMLFGRLEIFPMLYLFLPSTWLKN